MVLGPLAILCFEFHLFCKNIEVIVSSLEQRPSSWAVSVLIRFRGSSKSLPLN